MNRYILSTASILALIFTCTFQSTLHAQPEAWPSTGSNLGVSWVGYTFTNAAPIQDPNDIPNNQIEFDLIHDATLSPYTIQFAASSTRAFFRLQVRNLNDWTVGTYLIFVANSSGTIIGKVYFTLTGNAGSIVVDNGTTSAIIGPYDHSTNIGGWAQFSSVPGTTYEYVDFQLPLATLYSILNINAYTPSKFYLGTNTGGGNINNINTDWMTPSTNGTPSSGDFSSISWLSVSALQYGLLPVELTSFSGYLKNNIVQLKWQTATEIDNFGFEIQRSITKDVWEVVGFVAGHGNANSPRYYSSENTIPSGVKGEIRYRLRQIDRDGTEEYSPVVMVRVAGTASFGITDAFPNPFNPSTTLAMTLVDDANVRLSLHDVTGREVLTLLDNAALTAGSHSVTINASSLPSGRYTVVMVAGGQRSMRPLLLSK